MVNVKVCFLLFCLPALAAGMLGCGDGPGERPGAPIEADGLSRLTAQDLPRRGVYDASGRQVLLRGANFNHLGDYWQVDPSLPTVAELGVDDWEEAAALGHSAVRLVTTWSAWEPRRDAIDLAYLARVKDAVAAANARGMYVVIDMHQDAWSKHVYTPAGESCPEGSWHQKGWDGAPLWATFTDGEPTCTPGRREESPAVVRAWDHFYANTDGIRDELVELWAFLAGEFAADDGVAGYDLLNEPGNGSGLVATIAGLTAFYRSAFAAIREAEAVSGSLGHIIFFEPTGTALPPGFDLEGDNLVYAPHNYAESIVSAFEGLLDLSFLYFDLLGGIYGAPVWTGEYNKFSDPEANDSWTGRFAALEDRSLFSGGAWWQWEQECGDPHNAQHPPGPEWLEEQRQRCGQARFRVSPCFSRAYPRAAPGMLTSLSAEPCGEDQPLSLSGRTAGRSVADLWYPSASEAEPAVSGVGIEETGARRVPGGWRLEAVVDGDYSIEVTSAARSR